MFGGRKNSKLNFRDYRENERLDRYELEEEVEQEEYEAMDMETRQLVEAKLRRRDREQARREGRLPAAYMDDGEDYLLLINVSGYF